MQNSNSIFYYELELEDVGQYGFTREKIIYRRGIPTFPVLVEDPELLKELKKEFGNGKKTEAREHRCIIKGKSGRNIRCQGCCKTCTQCHKPIVELEPIFAEQMSYEDEGFEIVENWCVLEKIFEKMDSKNPMYSKILRLRLKNKTTREIAKIMGKSQSVIVEALQKATVLAREIYTNEL